ncbi:MAG TPA: hypothetical protein VNW92_14950 [Polyangiaceae bacterium]|nr:hypothetical protein [Polyangiaceae bacterium]
MGDGDLEPLRRSTCARSKCRDPIGKNGMQKAGECASFVVVDDKSGALWIV